MASPETGAARRFPSWLGSAAVYAVSIGCLIWVYRGHDWKADLPRVANIHWIWIFLGVATDILVYVSQAWRWNLLLTPIARLPLGRSVQAIYIGLFANEVLPFRSGELIRCYLQARWNHIPFTTIVSSALIERLVDGVWLVFGFAMVSWLAPQVPNVLEAGAFTLALLVAGLGALVVFAVLNKRFARHVATRHRWSEVVRTLIEGLHVMGRSRSFLLAAAASVVYLGLQLFPIYAMMRGFRLEQLTLADAAIVLIVLRLSTVVPGLPGNIGLFQGAGVLALHNIIGLDKQVATSLTTVMFFVITVPLLMGGWIALAFTGLKIREIHHRARTQAPAHR